MEYGTKKLIVVRTEFFLISILFSAENSVENRARIVRKMREKRRERLKFVRELREKSDLLKMQYLAITFYNQSEFKKKENRLDTKKKI